MEQNKKKQPKKIVSKMKNLFKKSKKKNKNINQNRQHGMSKSFYNNKSLNDRNKQNIIQLMNTVLTNNSEIVLTEDQLDTFVNEIVEIFGENIANTMPKDQQQEEDVNENEEQEYDKDKIVEYVKEKLLEPIKLKEQEEQKQKEEQEHLSEQEKIQNNFKTKLEQECEKLTSSNIEEQVFAEIYNEIQDFLTNYNFKKKKDKKKHIKLDSKEALAQLVETKNDNKTSQIMKFYQKVCKKDINKFQESLLNRVKRLFNDYDITPEVVEEEQEQPEQEVKGQEQQKQYTFLTNDLVCNVLNIIGEPASNLKKGNVNMLLEKAQTLKDIVNEILTFANPENSADLSQYEQQLSKFLNLPIKLEEEQYKKTFVNVSNEQKNKSMFEKQLTEYEAIKEVKEKYPTLLKNIYTKEQLDEFNKNFEQRIDPFTALAKLNKTFYQKNDNDLLNQDDNNKKVDLLSVDDKNKDENQKQGENKIDSALQKIHEQVKNSVKDYQKGLDNKIEELKFKIKNNLSSFEKIKDKLNNEEVKDIDRITELFNKRNTLFDDKRLKKEEYIEILKNRVLKGTNELKVSIPKRKQKEKEYLNLLLNIQNKKKVIEGRKLVLEQKLQEIEKMEKDFKLSKEFIEKAKKENPFFQEKKYLEEDNENNKKLKEEHQKKLEVQQKQISKLIKKNKLQKHQIEQIEKQNKEKQQELELKQQDLQNELLKAQQELQEVKMNENDFLIQNDAKDTVDTLYNKIQQHKDFIEKLYAKDKTKTSAKLGSQLSKFQVICNSYKKFIYEKSELLNGKEFYSKKLKGKEFYLKKSMVDFIKQYNKDVKKFIAKLKQQQIKKNREDVLQMLGNIDISKKDSAFKPKQIYKPSQPVKIAKQITKINPQYIPGGYADMFYKQMNNHQNKQTKQQKLVNNRTLKPKLNKNKIKDKKILLDNKEKKNLQNNKIDQKTFQSLEPFNIDGYGIQWQ